MSENHTNGLRDALSPSPSAGDGYRDQREEHGRDHEQQP